MRRHATTLVLFLLAVVLGVWLWLDRDEVTEGERARRENNVFAAFRGEELSRIQIAVGGHVKARESDVAGYLAAGSTSARRSR